MTNAHEFISGKVDEEFLRKIDWLESTEKQSEPLKVSDFCIGEEITKSGVSFEPLCVDPSITINCIKSKKAFFFAPQEDITTFELTWITQLLVVISGSHGTAIIDVNKFITEHTLERHFIIA
jgi:hypothetical protein